MKKIITMILTFAVVISAVTIPSDKANAEEAVPTAPTVTPVPVATPGQVATTVPTYIPVPTQTPTPQEHEDIFTVKGYSVRYNEEYEDGKTVTLTKGFKMRLSLGRSGQLSNTIPQWTSSNPNVASIDAKGTVTGKKCGKTTITAEYGGTKSYITVNVVKNEYKAEHRMSGEITSIKYDKKGNLKFVYTVMDKMSKAQIKEAKKNGYMAVYSSKSDCHTAPCGGLDLVIKDANWKVVAKKTILNTDKDNYCCKSKKRMCHDKEGLAFKRGLNKPVYVKFTVKKKYLKNKNIDLRTCNVTFR